MKLLVVEDDPFLAEVLTQSLQAWRYLVEVAVDGQSGWEYIQSTTYDLLIIDVGLPRLDGISLCQKLRASGSMVPILLMTAKEATSDRIRGLDAGADDYLIKPINLEELQARLRALSRRSQVLPTMILESGELRLDPKTCQVTYDHKPLSLTPKEYNLLELFLRNPERVFSRGQLIELLWGFEDFPLEETVKAHIKGLRQKLKKVGISEWIENIYGLGYRFNPQVTNLEQKFKQEQAKLWQQYQGLMQERLDTLAQVVTALEQENLPENVRIAGVEAAHKLAGVLGMFDKDKGSKVAQEIEKLLDSPTSTDPIFSPQVKILVKELTAILGLNLTKENHSVSPYSPQSNLLIISPDLSLKKALSDLNHREIWQWEQVGSLEEAKLWLKDKTPEVVVFTLPQGIVDSQILHLIKSLTRRSPSIPVLAIAPEDNLSLRLAIAEAGARGFLVQPLTAWEIWQKVIQLLESLQTRTIHLLAVDDDPLLLDQLNSLVTPWGIKFMGIEDPAELWHKLAVFKPNLLILDVNMPEINGIDLCRALRNDPLWQDLPILFLTAHQEISIIQQIFGVGADDYLLKPVVAQEFLTRINYRLERQQLLQNCLWRDGVTGLWNQRYSWEKLELMVKQEQPFWFILLVLTDWKQIKRLYGYEATQQVLQSWGKTLQNYFSFTEILGYWGDGEFCIAMPFISKIESLERMESLTLELRTKVFTSASGDRFCVSYNYSIVEYPHDALTVQSLYEASLNKLPQ